MASRRRIEWPVVHAPDSFTRLPEAAQPGDGSLIRTPTAYIATHDTMPPPSHVITTIPVHEALRLHYQQTDRKRTASREGEAENSYSQPGQDGLRPAKTPRAS
ncbi:hypothetical protein P43SY_009078 [Pythium insidiosum]|uniref:DET1- and DDB1-associated protein 1 domain-containing protein n=1 Tax=Pythium insidiosum TaxID=114742 RepID=A0AAD5Q9W4_PYTIN|nr:hypothetical protein P43SY_009078 [Pythium insidiosum]